MLTEKYFVHSAGILPTKVVDVKARRWGKTNRWFYLHQLEWEWKRKKWLLIQRRAWIKLKTPKTLSKKDLILKFKK